ncbi:MAG: phosphatidylinositol kinase [Candidatus Omnitrophica bacterium]|nr:phosphatidylinositol kinase [Candidatus Omnitrophota bacterium]
MNEKIFRTAKVNYQDKLAGYLSETENGYLFIYDQKYLQHGHPISVSLPLRQEPYESQKLFSFFEGLLPEGWYLDIVRATEKIDAKDSFGLLISTTGDTIGAVTIQKEK